MRTKRKIMLVLACFGLFQAYAVSLDELQEKARQNYPLIRQFDLIEKTADFNLKNVSNLWLPKVGMNIQATYQSEVTEIPSTLGDILSNLTGMPVSFPTLTRDQYKAQAELTQLIYDGGVVKLQKDRIREQTVLEKEQLEVQFHKLKERIHDVFFGALLVREQITQTELMETELKTYLSRMLSLKENGLAQQSQLDQMSIEVLKLQQKQEELHTVERNFMNVLSVFSGEKLENPAELEKPEIPANMSFDNFRDELKVMEAQLKLTDIQRSAVNSTIRPNMGLFVNAGYGRPGLNMFTNAFTPYYIGGVRLSWNLSSLYNRSNDLRKLDVQKEKVKSQKDAFLFEQNLMADQQRNEMAKLKKLISKDVEIIGLHENIKAAENAKLDQGILTVTDLIHEINAADVARQQKIAHEIQLLSVANRLKLNFNN